MFGLLGTVVNSVAVIIGSFIGMAFNKKIPERISDALFKVLGLLTLFLGVAGCFKGGDTFLVVIAMLLGTFIGELIDLDKQMNKVGKVLERKFSKENSTSKIAEGFVTSSMVFCVGAMTIIGCMQAGLNGDNSILYTKSALDFCFSIIFASKTGLGVTFSSLFVFAYQGILTLCAIWINPFLSDVVVTNMSCVGYIIIIGLSLKMLNIVEIKVTNLVPAMFLPILLCPLGELIISWVPFLSM